VLADQRFELEHVLLDPRPELSVAGLIAAEAQLHRRLRKEAVGHRCHLQREGRDQRRATHSGK
jgi:hypothetical protein